MIPTGSPIMMLNEDCLLNIFDYLTKTADLCSIKDTCKTFRRLANRSFKLHGNKTLSIDNSSKIEGIRNLQHFGQFIDSITLNYDKAPWGNIFTTISKVGNVNLKRFSLSLKYYKGMKDEHISCIAKIAKNVEMLELHHFWEGRHINLLLSYCENLKEISIDVEYLKVTAFWCTKNRNINRLTLYGLADSDAFDVICENLSELEYLALEFYRESNIFTEKLNNLIRLNHLKELKLQCNYQNAGPLIQNLAQKNILEKLTLSHVIIDETIANAFFNFTQLKELTLQQMHVSIPDNMFHILSRKLVNIEKLYLVECTEIRLENISTILEKSSCLKLLLIYECDRIGFIDSYNYQQIKNKKRNFKIFLTRSMYEKTIQTISVDPTESTTVEIIPTVWASWHSIHAFNCF